MLLLSACLLFFQLDAKSLWIDEFFSVTHAGQDTFEEFVVSYLSGERQPPLHFLLLRLWTRVAGQSDFAVRFPWAALGVGTVAALYALGKKLLGSRQAVLAASLLAGSPFFVLYARMARYYALTAFLGVVSTWLLVLALEGREARSRAILWVAYSLAATLLLFTSYPAVALLLCQGLYFLASLRHHRPSLGPWLWSQMAIGAVLGAWGLLMAARMIRYPGQATPYMPQGGKGLLMGFLYPFYTFSLGETIFPWHPLAVVGGLLTAALAIAGLRALRSQRQALLLIVSCFVLSLLSTLAIFALVMHDLPFANLPNRAIFALPFFCLLLATGLGSLPRPLALSAMAVLALVYASSLANYYGGRQFHNPIYVVPSKEMVQMVLARSRSTDLIVSDYDSAFSYYYGDRSEPAHLLSSQSEAVRTYVAEYQPSHIWTITLGRDRTRDAAPTELLSWLQVHYRVAGSWGYAEQDPVYSRIKERLLGYEDYRYKAVIQLYERDNY